MISAWRSTPRTTWVCAGPWTAPAEIQVGMHLPAGLTADLSNAVADTASRETFDRAAALTAAQYKYLESQDAAAQRVVDYVTRNCTAAPG